MTVTPSTEYDVIIAGGGTAGCVIAARLTEAFPTLEILLLEAGPDPAKDESVTRPLQGMFSALMGAQTAKVFTAEPDKQLNGRALPVAAGNTLGGGSAVNFMIYNQAPASGWDDWNQPGWSYREIQPLMHRAISYKTQHGKPDKHGEDGPMVVTNGGHQSPEWMEDFFRVVPLTRDMQKLEDMADQEHADGSMNAADILDGWHAKWIDTKGNRSTAYHFYIADRKHLGPSSKLAILTDTKVDKILLSSDLHAIGVKLVSGAEIKAKKQVILSAGGFGSPMILERSGIGGKALLEAAGVDVKVDLSGVGHEYRDKQLLLAGYHIDDTCETLDSFLSLDMATITTQMIQFMTSGTGQVATNGINMGFKVRPTAQEIAALGADFAKHWEEVTAGKTDKAVVTGALSCQFIGDRSTLPAGKYMAFGWWTNYQASAGKLHISSANPDAAPKFEAGLLGHPADMPVLVWIYKWTREIARRMKVYRGEYATGHPSFSPESPAACRQYDAAPADDIIDIVYTTEDDRVIEDWIRSTVISAWHSMSTCPMGSKENGGAVDHKLNVYGVSGLKVADVSVVPKHMGTNMTSVALAIGEKCASIVEGGLQKA